MPWLSPQEWYWPKLALLFARDTSVSVKGQVYPFGTNIIHQFPTRDFEATAENKPI